MVSQDAKREKYLFRVVVWIKLANVYEHAQLHALHKEVLKISHAAVLPLQAKAAENPARIPRPPRHLYGPRRSADPRVHPGRECEGHRCSAGAWGGRVSLLESWLCIPGVWPIGHGPEPHLGGVWLVHMKPVPDVACPSATAGDSSLHHAPHGQASMARSSVSKAPRMEVLKVKCNHFAVIAVASFLPQAARPPSLSVILGYFLQLSVNIC